MEKETRNNMLEHIPNLVTHEENDKLTQPITENEVWEPMNSFNIDKEPKPNGFSMYFYNYC